MLRRGRSSRRVEILGYCDGKLSAEWIVAAGARVMNLLVKGSERHCRMQLRMAPEQHRESVAQALAQAKRRRLVVNAYLEDWSDGVRDSFDYPMMGVAAALRLDGDRVSELHIVVNAVDTRPLPFEDYTAPLAGRRFDEAFIEEVAEEVTSRSRPVKNLVLSTAYRKKMIGVFLARILRSLKPICCCT